MKDQYIEEQIKTMFKVSKKLYQSFSDIKKLTRRCLIKVQKIKAKRARAISQIQEKKKRDELEAKKIQKLRQKKQRREKQIQEQKKNPSVKPNTSQMQDENERRTQQKSIINIIKPSKQKQVATKLPVNKISSKNRIQQNKVDKKQGKLKPKLKEKIETISKTTGKVLEKPTHPESPYYRFLRKKKSEIKSSVGNIPMQKVTKIMRNIWEKLSVQQQREYVQPYQRQLKLFEKQNADYYRMSKNNTTDTNKQDENKKQTRTMTNFDFIDELDKM